MVAKFPLNVTQIKINKTIFKIFAKYWIKQNFRYDLESLLCFKRVNCAIDLNCDFFFVVENFKKLSKYENVWAADYDHTKWANDKIQLDRCVESLAICAEKRWKNRCTLALCQVQLNLYLIFLNKSNILFRSSASAWKQLLFRHKTTEFHEKSFEF